MQFPDMRWIILSLERGFLVVELSFFEKLDFFFFVNDLVIV